MRESRQKKYDKKLTAARPVRSNSLEKAVGQFAATDVILLPKSVRKALSKTARKLLSQQADRLMIAFDNIREGLAMYDGNERIVMMNPRYAEMYQVPPELQVAGTQFATLLQYWSDNSILGPAESREVRAKIAAGQTGANFRLYLLNGRVYEVNEQSLPDGGWVSTHDDITDRFAAETHIRYLAEHDPLTGLCNRTAFQDRVAAYLKIATGSYPNGSFALLMLDLDRFKSVNDLHGHAAGDQVLIEVAARMHAVLGESATLARLGGDEFAMVVDFVDADQARAIALVLIEAIRQPIAFGRIDIEIGASIGIAHGPLHGSEASSLLKCADRALYAAKHIGHGPVANYHSDLDAEETARAELIRRLPMAMQNGEIELYFQPIVDASSGICRSAEALLRWTHPMRGRISPEHVIAIAEESRMIGELGSWILRHALATAAQWPDTITVAVNLSASQLRDITFANSVVAMIKASGLASERLELELTETVLCSDEAIETIRALREEGVRFSLDDFGTGYASMSYLLQFPFDRVKIDRSFVSDVDKHRDRRIIVEAIAGLATKLGLQIVAEGVETETERAIVREAGCTFLQGYLFAKPMASKEFKAYLDQQQV